jgi:hypothetical protein
VVWPPDAVPAALAAVDAELRRLDLQASRFRDDSEISLVHRTRRRAHQVSRGLAEVLRVALAAARWTDGLADPTVGGALSALGYDRDFASIGTQDGPLPVVGPVPGWRSVTLDGSRLRLADGVCLDLGATAKGLGADRAAAAARRACRRGGVLVSLGGDIAAAGAPPPRPAAGRRLAGRGRGFLPRWANTARAGRQGHRGGGRDIIDSVPAVAARGSTAASHRGSAHRLSRPRALADRVRSRAKLRCGQRRRDGGDRGGIRRACLADPHRPAGQAGRS